MIEYILGRFVRRFLSLFMLLALSACVSVYDANIIDDPQIEQKNYLASLERVSLSQMGFKRTESVRLKQCEGSGIRSEPIYDATTNIMVRFVRCPPPKDKPMKLVTGIIVLDVSSGRQSQLEYPCRYENGIVLSFRGGYYGISNGYLFVLCENGSHSKKIDFYVMPISVDGANWQHRSMAAVGSLIGIKDVAHIDGRNYFLLYRVPHAKDIKEDSVRSILLYDFDQDRLVNLDDRIRQKCAKVYSNIAKCWPAQAHFIGDGIWSAMAIRDKGDKIKASVPTHTAFFCLKEEGCSENGPMPPKYPLSRGDDMGYLTIFSQDQDWLAYSYVVHEKEFFTYLDYKNNRAVRVLLRKGSLFEGPYSLIPINRDRFLFMTGSLARFKTFVVRIPEFGTLDAPSEIILEDNVALVTGVPRGSVLIPTKNGWALAKGKNIWLYEE